MRSSSDLCSRSLLSWVELVACVRHKQKSKLDGNCCCSDENKSHFIMRPLEASTVLKHIVQQWVMCKTVSGEQNSPLVILCQLDGATQLTKATSGVVGANSAYSGHSRAMWPACEQR